jgi:hypothetical protein
MKDELVSYETAVLAKEKGFDLIIQYYYRVNYSRKENNYSLFDGLVVNKKLLDWNSVDHEDFPQYSISAPTQSLLQRWLREKHKIIISIKHRFLDSKGINIEYTNNSNMGERNNLWYKTYEEALEIGLQESLKLIKT